MTEPLEERTRAADGGPRSTGAKVVRRAPRRLGVPWMALLKRVGDRYERAGFPDFSRYASANGIEPEQVDDRTVADFARI